MIFSGESKKLRGFYCAECRLFDEAIGREKKITISQYFYKTIVDKPDAPAYNTNT
jgi:hypothetical protein